MKSLLCLIITSLMICCSLATPFNIKPKWNFNVSRTKFSKYKYGLSEGKTTSTTTTTANLSAAPNACNVSINENSSNGRIRRSIHYSISDTNTTETTSATAIDVSILSPEFINCTHINIEPECYVKLPNGSVYVPLYGKLFDRSNYIINQQLLLFICPDFFADHLNTEKYPDNYFHIVSLVCSVISAFCIVLHIVTFVLVKKLRNLPGYCLLSLCVALLIAYICTFIVQAVTDLIGCTILGMFLMYYLLASFFWMNTMAYDVWKSIRMATAKLRLTTDRPIMVQFARYSFYAWGTPLMIVIIAIIIHFTAPEHSKYRLIFSVNNCWFTYKQALTLYFAGPLFTLIGANVLFFGSSFSMISSATINRSPSKSHGRPDLWSRLLLCLKLGSVMGFMWIIGIIAMIAQQEWLWYLYSVCSALQGVFIFFSFTVSERARKACKKALQERNGSVMPTQTTSQHGTSGSSF